MQHKDPLPPELIEVAPVLRGYRTELCPTPKQVEFFEINREAARFAYNWALVRKRSAWQKNKEDLSINVLREVIRLLKKTKPEMRWLLGVIDRVVEYALIDLKSAYSNFFGYRAKIKAGVSPRPPKVGFPSFKPIGHSGSFSFFGTVVADQFVNVPRLGKVRLKEAGYLPVGKNSHRVTITKRAERWFVTVLDRFSPPQLPYNRPTVGLDVNIRNFLTLSNGVRIENPHHIERFDKKIRFWNRRLSKRKKGGSNWHKARIKLAKLHYRCACARRTFLHQVSTGIIREYGKVVVETLGVRDMMAVHRLARDIADCGWYEFRRQLTYKGEWYGTEVIAAPREFPSTQECPECKTRCKVDWKKRTCTCPECGVERDMDDQAADNLLRRAQ